MFLTFLFSSKDPLTQEEKDGGKGNQIDLECWHDEDGKTRLSEVLLGFLSSGIKKGGEKRTSVRNRAGNQYYYMHRSVNDHASVMTTAPYRAYYPHAASKRRHIRVVVCCKNGHHSQGATTWALNWHGPHPSPLLPPPTPSKRRWFTLIGSFIRALIFMRRLRSAFISARNAMKPFLNPNDNECCVEGCKRTLSI